MSAFIDLTGARIGKLSIVSRANNKKGKVQWKCVCDCGNKKTILACNLLTKASRSCGCGWSKSKNKNHKWNGCGELGGTHFWEIRDGAFRRDIPFNLSINYLWKLYLRQNKKCALSGMEISMKYEKDGVTRGTASLDRINNNLGYSIGNVQWVHTDINFMKQDLSQNEFIMYCGLIVKNMATL